MPLMNLEELSIRCMRSTDEDPGFDSLQRLEKLTSLSLKGFYSVSKPAAHRWGNTSKCALLQRACACAARGP